MPSKSIKSVVVEVSIIVLTMSVIGHLTVNFWERYFVKSELAQMKESLHTLKNTLLNIGNAYDALNMDIRDLTEISAKNSMLRTSLDCNRFKNTLDRRRLHDIEVKAIIEAKQDTNVPKDKTKGYDIFPKINPRDKFPLPFNPNKDNHIANHDNHKAKNDNQDRLTPKETIVNEPIDFYPFKKNEAHDIMTNADLKTITKNPAKANVNGTSTTRNLPRSV